MIEKTEIPPVLKIEELTIHLHARHCHIDLLRSVSMEAHRNNWINITGESGSGKTMLLKAIAGLEPFHDGRISINGIQVGKRDSSWRKSVSFASQENSLFKKLTLEENISYIGLLNDVDLADEEYKHNFQRIISVFALEPWLGRIAGECGEAVYRKTQIAIALLKKPDLLIADDPWSGLDSVGRHAINNLLRMYTSDGGIVITSSIDLADSPDLLQYRIKDGIISC